MCLNSVLNVKALEGTFNQEKALVVAFSVIVQLHQLDNRLHSTIDLYPRPAPGALRGGAGGRAGVHADQGAEAQAEVDRGPESAHQPGAGPGAGSRAGDEGPHEGS